LKRKEKLEMLLQKLGRNINVDLFDKHIDLRDDLLIERPLDIEKIKNTKKYVNSIIEYLTFFQNERESVDEFDKLGGNIVLNSFLTWSEPDLSIEMSIPQCMIRINFKSTGDSIYKIPKRYKKTKLFFIKQLTFWELFEKHIKELQRVVSVYDKHLEWLDEEV